MRGVWLEPVAPMISYDYASRDIRRLSLLVDENCALFMEKWNEYSQRR